MRIFLAVFPPPAVQDAAFAMLEALRPLGHGVSWVKRDNLHYTLRFLGEIDEAHAQRAIEAAREAAAATPAFDAALGAAGAFPTPRRARVLWIGMAAGGPQLVALAGRLATALERHGWEAEARPFSPHLTIGRVREPSDWSGPLASAAKGGAAFRVENLAVVHSQLHPRGSIYSILENAPLATAPV